MTIVKTENVGPTPRPVISIHTHRTGIGVSLVSWVISRTPMPISVIDPTISHL